MEGLETIEDFVRRAGHDLNEPTRKISAFATLLKLKLDPDLDAQTEDALGYLVDAANRQHGLIEAVLGWLKAATRPLEIEPVDLKTVAEQALARLADDGLTKDAEIEISQLHVVLGDRALIRDVFEAIMRNSLTFKDEDSAQLRVGRGRPDLGDASVVFTDQGIGIADEFQVRVFEPFERLHPRDAYPGHGLGLSVCKMALTRLGGAVTLTSTPGASTSVTLSLPRARGR